MRQKRKATDHLPFAKVLKGIMNERGLTVRAIAEMAGVSSSVAQNWLSLAAPHDLQAVAKLAKALKIEFRELLLGEPEEFTGKPGDLKNIFDEQDLFEGICKVKIQRLMPKKGKL